MECDVSSMEELFKNFSAFCLVSSRLANNDSINDYERIATVNTGTYKGVDSIVFIINGSMVTDLQELEDYFKKGYIDVLMMAIQAKTSEKFSSDAVSNLADTLLDFLSEDPKYPLVSDEVRNAHTIFRCLQSKYNESK
ncbi:hypothetical protein [Helicobacter cetorum]|uniref:hypothetical protein n=1 Tax=Helicobacter cetorum TaxID=138563 RepID=UPI001305177F|nr:hypothetical protein [Helicobacter cetorum]